MSSFGKSISRRRFAKRLAVNSAAAGALLPVATQAQQRQGPPLSEPENAEVEARYAESVRKYGSRMDDAQKQRIKGILTTNERMLARIREFPLDNGDSPASTLKLAEGK